MLVLIKMVLWRKSHLSDQSHFKTWKRSLYRKKNAVYYFQISVFIPEIFEFLKYANYANTLNQILTKYDEERYLRQFVSEMFDSLH